MKQFKIILGLVLFASVTTFAQSPRIKLNQITKDTIKGSVLISNPTDSGMVYSRDFYIAYGADTVLILYGDTLAVTSEIISSVLSDGVTITGDGTTGNELKVDTSTVISTIQGLVDSLTNYVTTNTAQTISGAKTFTSDLNVDGKIALNAGDNNVVIGDGAGASLVSGQGIRNVLIGTEAGRLIDNGDDNVANGYRVLYNATSGSHNIGVGSYALYLNTSGSYNIANGGLSLYANETGLGNIANGFYALHNNLSGSYNIGNAYESLYSNTSGDYNIGSGYRALYSLNSGSDNQAYGYDAGRYFGSGSSALTTANGSLFIGSNTRASANGNSNEIVIGTDAIGNGSNSVTIGNNGTIGTATTKTILNGNVGIGTTSPSSLYGLTLNGSSTNTGGIVIKQSGTDVMYMGNITVANTTDFEFWNPRNGYTRFATNNIERMRIDASGNVGIGTTSPNSAKLQVRGAGTTVSTNSIFVDNSNNAGLFAIRDNGDAFILGNVGIGESSPSAKLDVVGSTELNGALTQSGGDANFDSGTLYVDESLDRVGIGETSPSYKLDVNGDVRADTYYYDVGSSLVSSSDARLKTNIQSMNNISDKLKSLNLIKYEWNDIMYKKLEGRISQSKLGGTFEGMIAQQVESIFPEYVGIDKDGYKTLSYVSFIVPLLKGFQEQQAIIETQQQKITDLESTIQALITRIENLENK